MDERLSHLSTVASSVKRPDVSYEQEDVTVSVYDSFESLVTMERQWDDFVESAGGEIFLSYGWCRVWWKYYGENRALKIFVFRCQNRLVGIIPLFFEKVWLGPVYAKTVKIVGSDFTMPQFSLPIEHDYMQEVAQKLFASISEYDWDIIHLGPISGLYRYYDNLKHVCEELLNGSHLVLSENKSEQTCFKLTNTWDEYLAALNRKERSKIKRHYRLASKAAGNGTASVVSNCATTEDFQKMFSDFVQMHQKHWQKLGKLGHFGDWHSALEFHRELAQTHLRQDRLRLIRITLGNLCLGYKYGYVFGDTYFDFLDARSDRKELVNVSLGRIIYSEMIKEAIWANTKWLDSMRGKYQHKLEMGGELFPTKNLYVIPKKTATVVRVRLFRFLARLLNLLYYRIWYCKVAPKLPLDRKGLWRIWIRTCGLA